MFDLALIWGLLIALAVLIYVILDGFDLGIGILFPLIKGEQNRDVMMNSVAPVWDGNETWLVLGGGGLFAVFPLAYSVILTSLYAPLIAMLLALIFRGVAFEFRFKDARHKPLWDLAFAGGSILATFCQGVVLGAFIQGIEVQDRAYAGGWFDWLTPFSLFTGFALVVGYALLGAGWLVMKTEGPLQARVYDLMTGLAAGLVFCIGIVSLWTPLLNAEIAGRWFSWPGLLYLSPVPILVLVSALGLYRAIRQRREVLPFVLSLGLFVLSYAGLGLSLYPNIVPPDVTLWQAAAPDKTLGFMLVGAAILLPLILGYTSYAYWVFRGKVRPGDGYH
ncbi:cytochrome d ubiquinol oxidase subunit II [Pelagibius litoralis]|uniref:Cytochrome d ubiquinol oxidase subunit II n=1 Tax=Pelagibius litoralis TaxID=374515 RepID=A0A967EWU4_9PROT|nr:cytochrome d ubiquinol oxidase subunit II [Pelagibius litoralis]NIA68403.1 cytochrome d ubiquinol oxidase subunit II [Pelagibius litoralis]